MTYNLERFYRLEARHQQLAAAARDSSERVRTTRQLIAEIVHDIDRVQKDHRAGMRRRPLTIPEGARQIGAHEYVADDKSPTGRLQTQLANAKIQLERHNREAAEAEQRAQAAGRLVNNLREFLRSKGQRI